MINFQVVILQAIFYLGTSFMETKVKKKKASVDIWTINSSNNGKIRVT